MDRLLIKVEPVVMLSVPTSPARPGDAGLDLMNAGPSVSIQVGETVQIPCGIRVKIPEGHFGMITGRSSTFSKKGILVPTSVIDEGYVGPLYVVAHNPGVRTLGSTRDVRVELGERIAQLVVIPYARIDPLIVDELPDTERGSNGFGSTG